MRGPPSTPQIRFSNVPGDFLRQSGLTQIFQSQQSSRTARQKRRRCITPHVPAAQGARRCAAPAQSSNILCPREQIGRPTARRSSIMISPPPSDHCSYPTDPPYKRQKIDLASNFELAERRSRSVPVLRVRAVRSGTQTIAVKSRPACGTKSGPGSRDHRVIPLQASWQPRGADSELLSTYLLQKLFDAPHVFVRAHVPRFR